MSLVEVLPYDKELRRDPPVRLDLDSLVVPPNVDLTLVGNLHNTRFSSPDYLSELLAENYVYFVEAYAYDPAKVKNMQHASRGYGSAIEKIRKLDEVAINRATNPHSLGNARWSAAIHEALFKSGVRVKVADVANGDPAHHREYLRAMDNFGRNTAAGRPVEEADMLLLAEREMTILAAICSGITQLRQEDPKLDSNEPLKAIGLYGLSHINALIDGLSVAADQQGVESFRVRSLFNFESTYSDRAPESEASALFERVKTGVVYYQEWLRTEPEPVS